MKLPEIAESIRNDCKSDVAEFEGKPFTGETIGRMHGTIQANIANLASVVAMLAEKVEKMEAQE